MRPECTCRVEWNGPSLDEHELGCPWYQPQHDNDPATEWFYGKHPDPAVAFLLVTVRELQDAVDLLRGQVARLQKDRNGQS